jgi:hypothetical protein
MNDLSAAYFDSHISVLGKKSVVGTPHVRPRPRREGNIKKGILKKYVGRASAGFISLRIGTSCRTFEGRVPYNAGIFSPQLKSG